MALELMDEHEKGEHVRAWLRNNGSAIAFGVSLGIAALVGYSWWDSRQAEHRITASTQYQALTDAMERNDSEAVAALAAELAKSYSDTPYAALAAFQLADAKLASGDFDAAGVALEQARSLTEEPEIRTIANLRLARVALAKGEHERAIELAAAIDSGAFEGLAKEILGDALIAVDRRDDARSAYEKALVLLDTGAPNRAIVEMKLTDLGGVPASPEA